MRYMASEREFLVCRVFSGACAIVNAGDARQTSVVDRGLSKKKTVWSM